MMSEEHLPVLPIAPRGLWRRMLAGALAAASLLLLPTRPAEADCGNALSADEIVRCLQRAPAEAPILTRSLPRPGEIATSAPAGGPAPSGGIVNIQVNFGFNSARLTPEVRTALDTLGRALTSASLRNSRFEIAGHTDAVGSDNLNNRLSEERARAVCDYLAGRYEIPRGELKDVGYGRTRLRDPQHPNAAVNRRVEITNLGK